MPEPFQYVQQAEQLRSEQRYREAENAFRRALEGYERAKDMDGIAYTLGRIGAAYEQSGEASKAIDAYQRAVQIGTDLPAIYHSLIILLVERNQLDEAFTVAGQWQLHGQAHLAGPAHDIFIEIGARLVRDEHFDTAVAVLARAVEVLSVQTYPEEHWKARGVLALAYEKAGDSDKAMRLCAEAIDSGSSDRQTYARYVMFLERQKRYDDALTAVRRGLKVQRDAAWEADLRQRQQRIERKAGKLDKDAAPAIIPMFSVRRGSKSIVLLHQIKLSPQLTDLAVGGQGLAYTVSGGQKPKLSAWRLEDASLAWQVDLPEVAAGVLLARDTLVTYAREGRIGEGSTTLRFYDLAGNTLATQRLPDVVSEVVAREGMVYAGCRDGRLYAFTSQGRSEWFFEVPGSTDQLESASMRPCPYYVRAADDRVIFSSYSQLFALDSRGKLRWRWTTPERKSSSRAAGVTITISMGSALITGLALPEHGSWVLATAGDVLYQVGDGEVISEFKQPGKNLGAVEATAETWGIVADGQAVVLRDQKIIARIPAEHGAKLRLDNQADRILVSAGKGLWIANMAGKLLAELEFVKSVSATTLLLDGRIVVGAGHLIVLSGSEQTGAENVQSLPQQASNLGTEREKEACKPKVRPSEERGIPVRWIEAERIPKESGKALYRGETGQPVTIEQLALEHYRHLGYAGGWTENDYWWAIMALLFWDVIFAKLPGVFSAQLGPFPGPMQDMPHDFFKAEFFERRKALIERRIAELTESRFFGLRRPSIEAELAAAHHRYHGQPCRPIDWARFPRVDDLLLATRAMGPEQLIRLLRQLLENFGDNRRGLPDLFLAKGNQAFMVEVKSEREQIADHQWNWLIFLRDQVNVPVEICRVITRGQREF